MPLEAYSKAVYKLNSRRKYPAAPFIYPLASEEVWNLKI